MSLQRIAAVLAVAVFAMATNGSAQRAGTSGLPAGALRIELRARPSTELTVPDLANWTLVVRITNLTTHPIDLRVGDSVLTVNGRSASATWPLAVGNGPRDSRLEHLRPGGTIEARRAMQAMLFHAPGVYALQLRIGGDVSVPLVVRVGEW